MDRDRWNRIEELFHAGLEIPPEEWSSFVARHAIDAEMESEILSLLRSHAEEDDLVVDVVTETLREVVDEGSEQKRFGPYRADRKLGGGSQADVYLAERTDGEYRTQVAIKVAKRGLPTEDLRQRFRQERQILASLQHANIARLLDGGTTEDGLPFLVMEYVDGQPINAYCDRERLSIEDRLRLFRSVCAAVEHAHRNLIIHRDLKPSNILVNVDGRPILLDFGIAKLLAEPTSAESALQTALGLRLLTPAYASPEQVLGESLTTSTDVYSLGVVLYELLCGRQPYEIESLEPKALFETICETLPAAPSQSPSRKADDGPISVAAARGFSPDGLRQRLKGDLDTIALKALRKEPHRRYASVAALAEDIDRTLDHRPIRARQETFGYHTSKLVRRHPYGVATTLALLLAILIGVSATLRASWQAQAQRDRAQISQAEAERVTGFMIDLFEVASPEVSLGEDVSVVEVLDRGAGLIGDDLDDQPLSRARLQRAMGQAYLGLGLYERAARLFDGSVTDRQQALGEWHTEVAESLLDLARSDIAGGNLIQAKQTIERCLEICARSGSEADVIKASAESLLAQVHQRQGDIEQAETLYRRAVDQNTRLLGAEHLTTLESLNDLAEALAERRQLEPAAEIYERVLKAQRRQLSDSHPDVIKTLSNLAVAQKARGELESAETSLRDVVTARRKLYGENHPHVALAYSNLGQVLSAQGKNEAALPWLEKALEISAELYGQEHPRVGDLLYSAGFILEELGRLDDAEKSIAESLSVRRSALGDQHPAVAQSLVALAGLHHRLGDTERAISEARESHRILEGALPADDFRQSSPQLQLGILLAHVGRCEEARPFFKQAIHLRRKALPEGHPALASAVEASRACLP